MFNFKPLLGSLIQTGHPLSRGLLGYWLLNEGSGGHVQDLSGQNSNMKFSATAPSWMAEGIRSDSADERVESVNSINDLWTGLAEFTFAYDFLFLTPEGTRYYHSVDGATLEFVPYLGGAANNQGIYLRTNSGTLDTENWSSGGSLQLVEGQRYFLVYTWSTTAGGVTLYKDGVYSRFTTRAGSTVNSSAGMKHYLFNRADSARDLQGDIFSTMFWGRSLSPQEIWDLYVYRYSMFKEDPDIAAIVAATSVEVAPPSGRIMSSLVYGGGLAGYGGIAGQAGGLAG